MSNYVCYHLHSTFSLLDSATQYKDYIDYAAELGQKAICFTEHGNVYSWLKKKQYAESKGLKFLLGEEFYLTETLEEKIRDNYHTILIAKNTDGMRELFRLCKLSTQPDHRYYKPRLSFNEFLNISDNIIKISACVQSPLNKFRRKIDEEKADKGIDSTIIGLQSDMLVKLLQHYDYYEIQYHNFDEQKEFNEYLYQMSKMFNKPLIAATDTHSLNEYKAKCRTVLQYGKTDGDWGDSENESDLTYKSYDELVSAFKEQNCDIPFNVILDAINNTNIMANSVEEYEIDTTTAKYPVLYGDKDEEMLWREINEGYRKKVEIGAIEPNPKYLENAKEEMRVFKKVNMIGFMLFMCKIMKWADSQGIPHGISRGSCGGSTVAYLTDIVNIDPVKWNTVFSRFCNEDRVELGDIDTDWYEDDRPKIYHHAIEEFGTDKTAYIITYGTLADKSVIDTIGQAFRAKYKEKTKYTLDKIAEIKKEWDKDKKKTRKAYPDLFYYYDGLVGCEVSQGMHPAGIIVTCVNVCDVCGQFWGKNKQKEDVLISPLDMDSVHDLWIPKFDFLGLSTVGIINKTCKLIGKKFPKTYEVDWEDQNVFNDISKDSTGIFQFESDFAKQSIQKMQPKSVEDICLTSACIRPSGESYREEVFEHKYHKNPSPLIDNILSNSYGRLVYQEQTIAFLQQVCGFSGSEADNVRRGIGMKKKELIDAAMPKILDGYCKNSDKPREVAEQEAKEFLQVIEDSSSYSFGYNHAMGYAMLSYIEGYLRYYHTTEFCTSYLNCAKTDEDISRGTNLALDKGCKIVSPKFRHSSSEYGCDGDNKIIYKGISSIKDIGQETGDRLATLNNFQGSFVDLLYIICPVKKKGKPTQPALAKKNEIKILIKIGYFEEFGSIKKLLRVFDLFRILADKKNIKKDKAEALGLSPELIMRFAERESPTQFSKVNMHAMLDSVYNSFKDDKDDIFTKAGNSAKILGYCSEKDESLDWRYCVVLSANTKYSPIVNLYSLSKGNICTFKFHKKKDGRYGYDGWNTKPLDVGDVIYLDSFSQQFKRKKTDDGWVSDPNIKEWWCDNYTIVRKIE